MHLCDPFSFSYLKFNFAQKAFGTYWKLIASIPFFCPKGECCKQRFAKTGFEKGDHRKQIAAGTNPSPFRIAPSG
jgi:hypothetical protein